MRIHYGKAAIPVYRTDGVRTLFAAEVDLDVHGELFLPSYTEGDNSMVVATDTMKNFVHATALDFEGDALEDFVELLGSRFLEAYGDVERIRVSARALPFARESDVLFRRLEADYAVAELELDRTGILDQRSGRHGLRLLKITGSSFASFARDEHTTLPERTDRPLFVRLDLSWSHLDPRERARARTCAPPCSRPSTTSCRCRSSTSSTRWERGCSPSSRRSPRWRSRPRTAPGIPCRSRRPIRA